MVAFRPRDQEVIRCFLKKKISGEMTPLYIKEADVFSLHPKTLMNVSGSVQRWFFAKTEPAYCRSSSGFCHLVRRNSSFGTWKSTEKSKKVLEFDKDRRRRVVIGTKQKFKFLELIGDDDSKKKKKKKSEWLMEEFCVKDCKVGDWVMCRIYSAAASSSAFNCQKETVTSAKAMDCVDDEIEVFSDEEQELPKMDSFSSGQIQSEEKEEEQGRVLITSASPEKIKKSCPEQRSVLLLPETSSNTGESDNENMCTSVPEKITESSQEQQYVATTLTETVAQQSSRSLSETGEIYNRRTSISVQEKITESVPAQQCVQSISPETAAQGCSISSSETGESYNGSTTKSVPEKKMQCCSCGCGGGECCALNSQWDSPPWLWTWPYAEMLM